MNALLAEFEAFTKRLISFQTIGLIALLAILSNSCTVYNKSAVADLNVSLEQFIRKNMTIRYQVEGVWKTTEAKKNDFDAMSSTLSFVKTNIDFPGFEKYVTEKANDEGVGKWNKTAMFFNNLEINKKKGPVVIYLFFSDNKTYIWGRRSQSETFERVAYGAPIPAAVLMFEANFSEGMHVSERDSNDEAYFAFHVGEGQRCIATMNFTDGNQNNKPLAPNEKAYANLINLIRNAIENGK